MEKITVENCVDLAKNLRLELRSYEEVKNMAQAWNLVFKFCAQNKMKYKDKPLESVIKFIEKKIKK